jgi:transposase-like protein
MRLMPHPPEKRAEAKLLGETTDLSCTEIGARIQVAASTVRTWKREDGWRRPPGAPARRSFTAEEREAIVRLREAGASFAVIARAVGRHAGTIAHAVRRRGGAAAGPAAAPLAERAPDEVAELYETLLRGRACAFVAAEALIGSDPQVDRRAQALARSFATIKALPDDAPAAGAAFDNSQPGPATFDEINALLDELARRFTELGAGGDVHAAPGGPAAEDAAAPR